SSRRRHTRSKRDWSSDVCSSDLYLTIGLLQLLWAQLALHVPNASNPLADKLEEYYLFYIFCTFLFFRLFTHNVQVRERKRAQRRSEERRVGKERRDRESMDEAKE